MIHLNCFVCGLDTASTSANTITCEWCGHSICAKCCSYRNKYFCDYCNRYKENVYLEDMWNKIDSYIEANICAEGIKQRCRTLFSKYREEVKGKKNFILPIVFVQEDRTDHIKIAWPERGTLRYKNVY